MRLAIVCFLVIFSIIFCTTPEEQPNPGHPWIRVKTTLKHKGVALPVRSFSGLVADSYKLNLTMSGIPIVIGSVFQPAPFPFPEVLMPPCTGATFDIAKLVAVDPSNLPPGAASEISASTTQLYEEDSRCVAVVEFELDDITYQFSTVDIENASAQFLGVIHLRSVTCTISASLVNGSSQADLVCNCEPASTLPCGGIDKIGGIAVHWIDNRTSIPVVIPDGGSETLSVERNDQSVGTITFDTSERTGIFEGEPPLAEYCLYHGQKITCGVGSVDCGLKPGGAGCKCNSKFSGFCVK